MVTLPSFIDQLVRLTTAFTGVSLTSTTGSQTPNDSVAQSCRAQVLACIADGLTGVSGGKG
jgi:hypothetical protein